MIDLHTHTTASDGTLAPDALLAAAADAGIELLAITDHDTVAGIRGLPQRSAGPQLVSGIEFSTWWRRHGIHVVGLNFQVNHPTMLDACARQQQAREARARAIGERLAARGNPDVYAEAAALAGKAGPGRPHFAEVLVRRGVVTSHRQAFRQFLGHATEAGGFDYWAPLATVIEWIHAAGGTAVLAHPLKYRLSGGRLDALVGAFTAAGGDAIELVSGRQQAADTALLGRLARHHGLAVSLGSDFHNPAHTWTALGCNPLVADGLRPVWQDW